jgi:hypothetical protein
MKKLGLLIILLVAFMVNGFPYTFEYEVKAGDNTAGGTHTHGEGSWISACRTITIGTDVYTTTPDLYTPHAWAKVYYKYNDDEGDPQTSITFTNYDYTNDLIPDYWSWPPFYHAEHVYEVSIEVWMEEGYSGRAWARVDVYW